MKSVLKQVGVIGYFIATTIGLTGCGGGGGGSSSTTADDTTTFTQPVAGIALSSSPDMMYVLKGETSATVIPAIETALASDPSVQSSITTLNKSSAYPFELVTISGTGFRPSDAAISVIFRSSGLEPVIVPAIAVTTTTVEVAIPPFINASGENVSVTSSVQVFQIGQWGFSFTATQDGLVIGELPTVDATPPAGAVLDAYITAALNQITTFEAAAPGVLPASYWGALAAQKIDLNDLQTAVRQVMSDPAATPVLPSYGSGSVTLDAASLALADRLVAAMLLRIGEALEFTTSDTLPAGVTLAGVSSADCPLVTSGKWVDDFICQRQLYGQNLYTKGQRGIALGAKIEASLYLGLFGGVSTTLLGQISSSVSTAFELTWAVLSGHIAAWATANEPPAAGETLGEVSVAVLDKLAGTHGILSVAYTTVNMGTEYDAVIQEAATTTAGDTFRGTITTAAVESGGGCQWQHNLTLTLTITGFGGSGTMADPFYGTPVLSGTDNIVLISGGYCDAGGSVEVSNLTGSVDGDTGEVFVDSFAAVGTGGTLNLQIPNAAYNITSISGGYLLLGDAFDSYVSGTVTLTQQ